MPTLLHLPTKPLCIQVTFPWIMPRILTTSPTSSGITLSNPPSWASIAMAASQLHPCPSSALLPEAQVNLENLSQVKLLIPWLPTQTPKSSPLSQSLLPPALPSPSVRFHIVAGPWNHPGLLHLLFSLPHIPKGSFPQRSRFLLKGMPCSALPVSSSPSPACIYSYTAHLEFQHHEVQGHVLQCLGKWLNEIPKRENNSFTVTTKIQHGMHSAQAQQALPSTVLAIMWTESSVFTSAISHCSRLGFWSPQRHRAGVQPHPDQCFLPYSAGPLLPPNRNMFS